MAAFPDQSATPPSLSRMNVESALVALRERLAPPPTPVGDGWLSPRGGHVDRQRARLEARLTALEARGRGDGVRAELARLLVDVDHYLQRRNDLAYDEVEAEIGGSE